VNCAPGGHGHCKNGGNRGREASAAGTPVSQGAPATQSRNGAFNQVWGERPGYLSKYAGKPKGGAAASYSTRSSSGGDSQAQSVSNIELAHSDSDDDTDAASEFEGDGHAAMNGVTNNRESIARPAIGPEAPPPPFTAGVWELPANELAVLMNEIYAEVVGWHPNSFMLSYGAEGTQFVTELARLINLFAEGSEKRAYAWSAVVVASRLLLQKPFKESRHTDNRKHLERRMGLWKSGDFDVLLSEARCIQSHMQRSTDARAHGEDDDVAFARLVYTGKVASAARSVSAGAGGGPLSVDAAVGPGKTVMDVLLEKHPKAQPAEPDVLLEGDFIPPDPILYERITAALIRRISHRMSGSAGPSGLDAAAWVRMLTSYKASSDALCSALAAAARCLCTESVEGDHLKAFLAARLIPLDKKPGVRPIAVGEVFRRLIGKAVMSIIEQDVRIATAPIQVCVGVPSACEVSVALLQHRFADPDCDGVLLVDASNAFNAMNRQAALNNIPIVCPAAGQIFRNTYQENISLFVAGGYSLSSREGTCQGDPLAMAYYALAMMPLINKLAALCPGAAQQWFADDDAATGKVTSLRDYWDAVSFHGPRYGYHPNARKTLLLVKPEKKAEADATFRDTGVKVCDDGVAYLGGCLGSDAFRSAFVKRKVIEWVGEVERLSMFGATQPHAAHHVMLKSTQPKWQYLQRVTDIDPLSFRPLDDVVNEKLLPALSGHTFDGCGGLRKLIGLPVRNGGLAISTPSDDATQWRSSCSEIVSYLVEAFNTTAATVPMVPEGVATPIAVSVTGGEAAPRPVAEEVPPSLPATQQLRIAANAADVIGDGIQTALETASLPATQQLRIAANAGDVIGDGIRETKRIARSMKVDRVAAAKSIADEIRPSLSHEQQLLVAVAGEKGVSSWLSTPPTFEHNTVLSKSDFKDAISLRYGLPLADLPTKCVCGKDNTPYHAQTCASGGYRAARHDHIRDLLGEIVAEVCSDTELEPHLQPLSGESLDVGRTANLEDGARVDIRARGFWTRQQNAFFDVRVTHPKASLLSCSEVSSQLRTHEKKKKNEYAERIIQVERGSFTPLVFATNGQCGNECSLFLKALALQLHNKNSDVSYSSIMSCLRGRLSFCLLRWAITCMRGSRASYKRSQSRGLFMRQVRRAAFAK